MAFFDSVGRVLTETGQGAMQKTKDMAEIVKINAAISEEEKKVNMLISRIGNIVLSNLEAFSKEDLISYVNWKAAQESETRMETEEPVCAADIVRACLVNGEYLTVISEIKNCRENIAGMQEQIKTLRGVGKCPNCGADVQAGVAFCSVCGTQITENKLPQTGGRICPKCGSEVKEGFAFCTKCGQKLS